MNWFTKLFRKKDSISAEVSSGQEKMGSCHKCGRKVPASQLKKLMLINPGDPAKSFGGSACPSCYKKLTNGQQVL